MTMIGRTVYYVRDCQVLSGTVEDHEPGTPLDPEGFVIAVNSPDGTARIRTTGEFVALTTEQAANKCWAKAHAWEALARELARKIE